MHLVVNLEIELQTAVETSVEQAGELRQVRSVLKRVSTCQIFVKYLRTSEHLLGEQCDK